MEKETLGLFETMRAYQKHIVYFKQHLERLNKAAKLMRIKIPYSAKALEKLVLAKITKLKLQDAYVKLSIFKTKPAGKVMLEVKKYQPYLKRKYKEGFAVFISSFWKDETHPLAGVKSTDRLLYELSFQQARAKGYDEAIMLNSRGLIAEGTRSNVFFVKNNCLYAPCLKCGCLDGITRAVVLGLAKKYKIKTKQGNFTAHELLEADEAFLTNSLIGIMPLRQLGKIKIGAKENKLTQFFAKEYDLLLRGKLCR